MTESDDVIKSLVREEYGQAARQAKQGGQSRCGGLEPTTVDPITRNLYDPSEIKHLPSAAVAASLGCGDPTALTDLHEGETVLDLGSGGGLDVLLSARRVGLTGKVYGLDMTEEMLALGRENQGKPVCTTWSSCKGRSNIFLCPMGWSTSFSPTV